MQEPRALACSRPLPLSAPLPPLFCSYASLLLPLLLVLLALLVGGLSLQQQQEILSKRPHVLIATPGRILHHLEKTPGFTLKNVKFFVRFVNCMGGREGMPGEKTPTAAA